MIKKFLDNLINIKTVIGLSALLLAACAAFFSVTGIATLFAGAYTPVLIMASTLEFSKLVGVSFLYRYWKDIPRILKSYMLIASAVLIVITSAGIYGFLTAAYTRVAATPLQLTADIRAAEEQIKTVEAEILRKTQRLDQLITLRGQQENRLDSLVVRSSTGTSSAVRSAQASLVTADQNVTMLQQDISMLSGRRDSLVGATITKQVEIETDGDIGTFVYIAKILNTDLDKVVNIFVLIIVLVFDPLAVCMVLAYNFLVKRESVNIKETPHRRGKLKIKHQTAKLDAPTEKEKTFMVYGDQPPENIATPPPPEEIPIKQGILS